MDELLSTRTLVEIGVATFLIWFTHFLTVRRRRSERKEEREVETKSDAVSQITNWSEECLKYFNEISIKIHATDGPIKSRDIFSELQRLEVPGELAYSRANILGTQIRQKTKTALDNLREARLAFRNRDDDVWSKMPTVVSSFSDLIASLSKLKV